MFCPLFDVSHQISCVCRIFIRRFASFPGAGDWTNGDLRATQTNKNFWAGSHECHFAKIKMKQKGAEITYDFGNDKSIFVNADSLRISQVMSNLIENSLKYGVENGTIEILTKNISKEKLLIRVIDNGQGISEEDLPRVFERFYRVDKTRNRQEGGSGLGLAIVKHIVEAHNEIVYVESSLNVGSEFSFTLEKSY